MARFWRLQASISKGFGTDFSKMFDVFWAPLVSYQRFKFIAKSGQIVAKMWAFISPCAFSNAVLQMQAINAWQSPNILAHKWGGGGGPPLGEFNPPATEGVPTACQTVDQLALSNHSWPISTFFRAFRPEVFFPLSFPFPRSLGTTANPKPKNGKVCFFRIFSRFFGFPNRA